MLDFESQSYEVNDKNVPEVPVLRLRYPSEYDNNLIMFPIIVKVLENSVTATGKLLYNSMYVLYKGDFQMIKF